MYADSYEFCYCVIDPNWNDTCWLSELVNGIDEEMDDYDSVAKNLANTHIIA